MGSLPSASVEEMATLKQIVVIPSQPLRFRSLFPGR